MQNPDREAILPVPTRLSEKKNKKNLTIPLVFVFANYSTQTRRITPKRVTS